jgi:hypothetical protein
MPAFFQENLELLRTRGVRPDLRHAIERLLPRVSRRRVVRKLKRKLSGIGRKDQRA